MKIFIYKTIFVLIGVYILYQFTIGIKISTYERNLKNLTNDQGREQIRNKIRNELKKATEKDQILKTEDREILKKFITKIQKELNE
ncbi:MAG: hypothetical protein QGF65_02870 [Candidatus Pelagibacter bacterium]|jgi:hypothetical protein|nr:hypothetical protein [Arenicellales bacterium]MDP7541401.1 hypothetical protein [Candidatus Pelagibacter bacterium]|tara:strand:+ start:505 stop:762 length:258 start_codon:yes stop_codon:yes gene_type:complete